MSNAEAIYTNSKGLDLKLFLDIDLKTEVIQDFYYKGTLSSVYKEELEELKSLIMNRTYPEALNLKREILKKEVLLPNGKRPLATLSLWLTHQAIEDYLGNSNSLKAQTDLLCLCFGIGKKELKKEILNRADYDLKEVIAETFASSACGSCLPQIIKTLKDLREEHGLIKGLTHSQTRLDKEGHWLKIKGMYPAELVIKLTSLKDFWMKREGIEGQFQIEIKNIEGYHVWLEVNPAEDIDRNEKVLNALSDYWRSEIGALFFLHLSL
jgi:bacterioferritin-associated ferredoxin